MASSSRRTVLTGIGVLSPIGLDAASFWDSLSHARGGIRRIQSFDASGLPVQIAGEIPNFEAKTYLDRKQGKSLKVMARSIQLAVACAQIALDHSRIDKSKIDRTRFGVEFGASLIASELDELGVPAQLSANCQPGIVDLGKWGDQGLQAMPPLWMLKYLPNMLACHVSILHDLQGPNNTVTEGEAASLLALGEAFRIIRRDQADVMLVGGGESKINPLSLARQCLFQPLSHRNDAPEKASRPFDRNRDGVVVGEGAGILVLEELEHAKARGATIYGEMTGFGASFDVGCKGPGLASAIHAAFRSAGIGPDDIDHVNAHGLSDVACDAWEARGLQEIFGSAPVPVFAVKSYIGNLGAAGGTTELAASLLALQNGILPPTLNYEQPDPACPITVAAKEPRPVKKPYVLKISLTDMGQCAAVVVKRWE